MDSIYAYRINARIRSDFQWKSQTMERQRVVKAIEKCGSKQKRQWQIDSCWMNVTCKICMSANKRSRQRCHTIICFFLIQLKIWHITRPCASPMGILCWILNLREFSASIAVIMQCKSIWGVETAGVHAQISRKLLKFKFNPFVKSWWRMKNPCTNTKKKHSTDKVKDGINSVSSFIFIRQYRLFVWI